MLLGGNGREWKKVRKQWFALKDKAKKLKSAIGQTGGAPKPPVSKAIHLCMEVMARESLEGIRGRSTEVDPTGTATPEMSQDSSQDMDPAALPAAQTTPPVAAPAVEAATPPTPPTSSLVALQQQVHQLQAQMETLSSQPSALQRATEIRQLKFQEELLKLERAKLDLQRQALDVQKRMLVAMKLFEARALLKSLSKQ